MSEITLGMLRKAGACKDALEEFERRFGARVTVTEELAASVADVFDWDSAAAVKLLPPAGRAEYKRVRDQAWVECLRVRDQAWDEFERVRAQAWAEYKRVRERDQAWAEYKRERDQAWVECLRVRDPAQAEYHRVCARTFARLYAEGRSDE